MTSVISFLETMGCTAELRHAAKPALYKALNDHGVDQDAQWAILRGDSTHLSALLTARMEMICGMYAPNPDEDVTEESMQEVLQVA